MRIQVLVEDGLVRDVGFGTFGCAAAIACGSRIAEWARGKDVAEARDLTARQVLADLGGLPRHRQYCAELAVKALQAALEIAIVERGGK